MLIFGCLIMKIIVRAHLAALSWLWTGPLTAFVFVANEYETRPYKQSHWQHELSAAWDAVFAGSPCSFQILIRRRLMSSKLPSSSRKRAPFAFETWCLSQMIETLFLLRRHAPVRQQQWTERPAINGGLRTCRYGVD